MIFHSLSIVAIKQYKSGLCDGRMMDKEEQKYRDVKPNILD